MTVSPLVAFSLLTEKKKKKKGHKLIYFLLCCPQACIDGSMEMVTFLLEHGADVNQVDSEGWTPLHVAASCGYSDIAEYVV